MTSLSLLAGTTVDKLLVCVFAPDQARRNVGRSAGSKLFANLVGCKRREQTNLLFDFLESLSTIWVQSINLDTTVPMRTQCIRLLRYIENPSYHTISVKEFGSRSNMTLFACPDPKILSEGVKLLHIIFI